MRLPPRYVRLQDLLREKILRGDLQPGERLPAERELCRSWRVSRTTVRNAIRNLAREGLVRLEPGVGAFIPRPRIELASTDPGRFSDLMRERGLNPQSRCLLVETCPPAPLVARVLRLTTRDYIARIQRLRLADDEPLLVETSHLVCRELPGIEDEDWNTASLGEVLRRRYGIVPDRGLQQVQAGAATEEEASLLSVTAGAPVLIVDRTNFRSDGQPIEFLHGVYRGDRFTVTTSLQCGALNTEQQAADIEEPSDARAA